MKIVIKIGTTSVTGANERGINFCLLSEIAELIVKLKGLGHEAIIVSSGAIGLGCHQLGLKQKPTKITSKQAAAAVGQVQLAQVYEEIFRQYNQVIGQVLLTRLCVQDRERYLNARLTLRELLSLGVIPIVNENDVVADEEIRFSDNDYLSAVVSELIGADHLFMLTDTEGLFTADPRQNPDAELISVLEEITPEIEAMVCSGNCQSTWGTGGIASKLQAAKMATAFGTTVHILSNQKTAYILELIRGEKRFGSTFIAKQNSIDARKAWIAYGIASSGKLVIDNGAWEALCSGNSLLPIGIKKVLGKFSRGQALEICYKDAVIAKGISKYSSDDLERIRGQSSEEIEGILGYTYGKSAVHVDDLVILSSPYPQSTRV